MFLLSCDFLKLKNLSKCSKQILYLQIAIISKKYTAKQIDISNCSDQKKILPKHFHFSYATFSFSSIQILYIIQTYINICNFSIP